MATLSERVSALATAVANHIRDSVKPRLLPSGGSAGQVLAKSGAADYATEWQTPSGGGASNVVIGTSEPAPASGVSVLWVDTTGGNVTLNLVTG